MSSCALCVSTCFAVFAPRMEKLEPGVAPFVDVDTGERLQFVVTDNARAISTPGLAGACDLGSPGPQGDDAQRGDENTIVKDRRH